MGWSSTKVKARVCRDCRQSIHGTADELLEHVAICNRLTKLNLVVPGLVVGQQAVDTLQRAYAKRLTHRERAQRPRWS